MLHFYIANDHKIQKYFPFHFLLNKKHRVSYECRCLMPNIGYYIYARSWLLLFVHHKNSDAQRKPRVKTTKRFNGTLVISFNLLSIAIFHIFSNLNYYIDDFVCFRVHVRICGQLYVPGCYVFFYWVIVLFIQNAFLLLLFDSTLGKLIESDFLIFIGVDLAIRFSVVLPNCCWQLAIIQNSVNIYFINRCIWVN